ncbi:MAG: DUF4422 domain-containing protein [Lachnospiraceae bacterium]|nr:DUF4422 domain-containing protein [Lachnospiraceae bacterium]
MKSGLIPSAPFCIYGAGIVATSIYTAIKTLYNRTPLFFLISDVPEGKRDEEPRQIDGIAVKRLSEWKSELQAYGKPDGSAISSALPEYYLILAPEIHHPSIVESLHSLNIEDSHICLFTNELENKFMEDYYSSLNGCKTVISVAGTDVSSEAGDDEIKQTSNMKSSNLQLPNIQVFQAKCHVDRLIKNVKENPSYVYPIQVGADLTDKIITELRDNESDNISTKNRNYCELTATYYAWKNSSAEYKGLCHYRRTFDISNEQMQALLDRQSEWDVILPYPSIHYPNISTQHLRYIKDADWYAMLTALKETAPGYLETYNNLVSSGEKYFYNYNMLIARAEVFDDYCSFLFKVLERAEELTKPKGADRADRFAGYMGENLTTLYFLKNRDKLKILYSGKLWLT